MGSSETFACLINDLLTSDQIHDPKEDHAIVIPAYREYESDYLLRILGDSLLNGEKFHGISGTSFIFNFRSLFFSIVQCGSLDPGVN
jgi:hypothetical protein